MYWITVKFGMNLYSGTVEVHAKFYNDPIK